MKRHTRPYGCTFPGCNIRFGSKSDWKRHENAKHFQMQNWRCNEPLKEVVDGPDCLQTRRCSRIFHRRDIFIEHLRREHRKSGPRKMVTLRASKIGRNGQARFWCGFCRKLVNLTTQGLNAWDERFDHIDGEHYKNGAKFSEWIHPNDMNISSMLPKSKSKATISSTCTKRPAPSSVNTDKIADRKSNSTIPSQISTSTVDCPTRERGDYDRQHDTGSRSVAKENDEANQNFISNNPHSAENPQSEPPGSKKRKYTSSSSPISIEESVINFPDLWPFYCDDDDILQPWLPKDTMPVANGQQSFSIEAPNNNNNDDDVNLLSPSLVDEANDLILISPPSFITCVSHLLLLFFFFFGVNLATPSIKKG